MDCPFRSTSYSFAELVPGHEETFAERSPRPVEFPLLPVRAVELKPVSAESPPLLRFHPFQQL